jgi:hypothetical protein
MYQLVTQPPRKLYKRTHHGPLTKPLKYGTMGIRASEWPIGKKSAEAADWWLKKWYAIPPEGRFEIKYELVFAAQNLLPTH